MQNERPRWIAPIACFALALLVRLFVASRVHIPGRDGATYLWMGEQVCNGNFAASFRTVFPPVYPWCIAAVLRLAPDIDPMFAGQLASGLLSALAVFPLFAIAERLFDRRAAIFASLFFALGTWFARHPADCMTEGPFYLWVGTAVLLLIRGGPVASTLGASVFIALAYGTRPEGAGLALVSVPWMWLRDRQRAAWLALSTAAMCLLFPIGYAVWGHGFTLTPKAAFMWPYGAGRDDGSGVLFYLEHLLRLPGHVFEAVGYIATIAAAIGIAKRGDKSLKSDASLLLLLFALQLLVIPLARSTIRFVSGYGMLVLAFAGHGYARMLQTKPMQRRGAMALLALLAFGPDLVRLPQHKREDKTIERDLGRYLKERMQPGDIIVSAEHRETSGYDLPFSMCRIEWFVGMEPSPPRTLAIEELRAMAQDPRCRFGLIAHLPAGFGPDDLRGFGYEPHALPADLAERAAARRIQVFERR